MDAKMFHDSSEITQLARDIDKILLLGKESLNNDMKYYHFRNRLDELDHTFDKFLCFIHQARKFAKQSHDNGFQVEIDSLRDTTRRKYYEILLLSLPRGVPNLPHPKKDVPRMITYGGNVSEWPFYRRFYDHFNQKNYFVNDRRKLYLLRSTLTSGALDLITTSADYKEAWRTLRNKYDKCSNAYEYLNEIFNSKPMERFDLNEITSIRENVLVSAQCFKGLRYKDAAGFILCMFIMKLLDSTTRRRFELDLAERQLVPSFEELQDFLKRSYLKLEQEALMRPTPIVPVTPAKVPVPGLPKKEECTSMAYAYCSSDSEDERLQIIESDVTTGQLIKEEEILEPGPSSEAVKSDRKELCKREYSEQLPLSMPPVICDNNESLLGTAYADIADIFGKFHSIRLIIDSGCQKSFITASLVQKLQLEIFERPIVVREFLNSRPITLRHQAACALHSKSSPIILRTKAVIVTKIADQIPSNRIPVSVVRYFNRLDLADNLFWKPGRVDFLLGADLFCHILQGNAIHSQPGLPSALNTIFGWVLMGSVDFNANETQ